MVGVDDQLGGAIELQAAVRPEVRDIVARAARAGASSTSRSSPATTRRPTRKLAESLGMDRYFAQVLPADKADYVEQLQKEGARSASSATASTTRSP